MFIINVIRILVFIVMRFYLFFLIAGLLGGFVTYFFSFWLGVVLFLVVLFLLFFFFIITVKREIFSFPCPCGEIINGRRFSKQNSFLAFQFFDKEGEPILHCSNCNRELTPLWEDYRSEKDGKKRGVTLIKDFSMEKALKKIGEPLLEKHKKMYPDIVGWTVAIWNLTLLPPKKQVQKKRFLREEMIEKGLGPSAYAIKCIDLLIYRKKKYYPFGQKRIEEFQVKKEGPKYQIIFKETSENDSRGGEN